MCSFAMAVSVPNIVIPDPETSNISLEDIDKIFLPANMEEYAERNSYDEGSGSSKNEVNQVEKAV